MANLSLNQISPAKYISLVKNQAVRPRFRLSILYQDESIREDISDYIVDDSGRLEVEYAQGQRRSLNFTLNNIDGQFTPLNMNSKIWVNTKFKLELGMEFENGDIVWNSAGIFVVGNPNAIRRDGETTISIQCYDKFALLDGTLGGTLEATYEVPADTKIYNVLVDTLNQDNGNNYPIDIKPVLFDDTLIDEKTVYTLSKSANESLGDIFIELAEMISCDIYYNEEGNLVVQSGIKDISQVNKPTLWTFSDAEFAYLSSSIDYDFTKIKNRVIVVGSNVNSDNGTYVAVAENTNPRSSNRIEVIGTRNYYLEDSNIYSEYLAQSRADYELNKLSILQQTIEIESTFMIHLDVNNCVSLEDDFFEYYDSRFIIQSLTVPLSTDSQLSIICTNIASLPYYPS